jgi:hypothetical protein
LQEVLEILAARQTAKSNGPMAKQSQPAASSRLTGPARPKPNSSDSGPPGEQSVATGSPKPTDQRGAQKPDVEEIRSVMRRYWGQLPEHARQQMLQTPVEQFPPMYQSLIEEYYRRLAEEK